MNDNDLLAELNKLKSIMVSVSNGGTRIQSVNGQYQDMYIDVDDELRARDIKNGNPHSDLWSWYTRWKQDDLPSYASRREHLHAIFSPMEQAVRDKTRVGRTEDVEDTGWQRVDRTVREIRYRMAEARHEEAYQAIGLLCREAITSLAQNVYDPEVHKTEDGVKPSPTDAKRQLEAYINDSLSGGHNRYSRKFVKASFDLANELQHKRTADYRLAALCAEATISTINQIAIISGVRDPE